MLSFTNANLIGGTTVSLSALFGVSAYLYSNGRATPLQSYASIIVPVGQTATIAISNK